MNINLARIKLFEPWLWFALVALLPLQTRLIIWQHDWYFNEWRAAAFYATDIVVLGIFLYTLLGLIVEHKSRSKLRRNYNLILLVFLMISVASTLTALDKGVGVITLIRIFQGAVLFYALVSGSVFVKFPLTVLWGLIAGGVVQAVVAIIQFLKQGDLGLRFLGETALNVDLSGVAVFFNTVGEKVMRSYGTMPHPNILALYLAFGLAAALVILLKPVARTAETRLSYSYFGLAAIGYSVILVAFLLTFSRVVIGSWFLVAGFLYFLAWKNGWASRRLLSLIFIGTVIILIACLFWLWPEVLSRLTLHGQDEAVQLRLYYNHEAISSASDISFLGIGPGNFVSWLMVSRPGLARSLYQPVHNLYLLIYSEIGLFGVAVWVIFLLSLGRHFIGQNRYHTMQLAIIGGVAVLVFFVGFFDHFLWTTQQGRLMYWLSLALLADGTINTL